MSTYFVPDNSEFRTTDLEELRAFLSEREANSIWYTDEDNCRAADVKFSPILEEPIAIGANVEKLRNRKYPKFTASEEAYADTMCAPSMGFDGTTQMLYVNGHLYPVGASAVKGITERIKTGVENWEMLKNSNPEHLSQNLNNDMIALGDKMKSRPYLSILIQDEKVRAVNSGSYAICPLTSVLSSTTEWIHREYPKAKFLSAYASHVFTTWTLDLEAYTDDVLGAYPEIKNNGFTPALIVTTSHLGTSSISLKPALKIQDIVFPISEGIAAPHTAAGTASERTNKIENTVRENFNSVFPSLEKQAQAIDALRVTNVNNAHNALLRAMKSLKMPKEQALEAAELFKAIFPDIATAYDCYLALIDVMSFVARDFPKDYKRQFAIAKSMERALVGIDWVRLGNLAGDFSW
mgnify:CR=1 FL=1